MTRSRFRSRWKSEAVNGGRARCHVGAAALNGGYVVPGELGLHELPLANGSYMTASCDAVPLSEAARHRMRLLSTKGVRVSSRRSLSATATRSPRRPSCE